MSRDPPILGNGRRPRGYNDCMPGKVRRRGNPNWGKPPAVPPPNQLSEFEMRVKELGLNQQDYVSSAQLRSWCEHNRNHFYIPEWLLQEWGIHVELSYGP